MTKRRKSAKPIDDEFSDFRRVDVSDEAITAHLVDGRVISVPLALVLAPRCGNAPSVPIGN